VICRPSASNQRTRTGATDATVRDRLRGLQLPRRYAHRIRRTISIRPAVAGLPRCGVRVPTARLG
jgi:hypothetical protein